MANIYTLKSGNASDTTVWSSGTVPTSGDRVLISAGHTVVLDGTYEWGDDSTASIVINTVTTTSSITINGTLKASRTVNSQLTCNGNLILSAGASNGTYDAGTAADPIPSGVTHNLILNKSSVVAAGKYGFDTTSSSTGQSRVQFHGFYRNRNAIITSGSLEVGATTCTVDDVTGWSVGDTVVFAADLTTTGYDVRQLLTITPGTGTTATVTFAALSNAHGAACCLGNFSSNVNVRIYSSGYGSYINLTSGYTSGTFDGYVHIENVSFVGYGGSAAVTFNKFGILNFVATNMVSTGVPYDPVNNCSFMSTATGPALSTTVSMINLGGYRQAIVFNDCAFYNQYSTGYGVAVIQEYQGSKATLNDCVMYRSRGICQTSGYSQGGISWNHNRCKYFGLENPVYTGSGFNPIFTDCVFGVGSGLDYLSTQNISDGKFIRCDFGYSQPLGARTRLAYQGDAYAQGTWTYTDCSYNATLPRRPNSFHQALETSAVIHENINLDVTAQEYHQPAGSFIRDNTIKNRGASSIRLEPWPSAVYTQSKTINIPAPNNTAVTVVGYLRKNSNYGASTLPTVTLSGLGIATQTFTMSNSVDTWEMFSFTATQTSGNDGNLVLTFSAKSANGGAQAWFDGVPLHPFITAARHYGYKFQEASVARELDPVIQLSEEAVSTLSGLSVNWSTRTITLTANTSIRHLYDWAKYQGCLDASKVDLIQSADGVNFTLSANLILSGGNLTGSGSINLGSYTLTSGSNYTTLDYLDSTGDSYFKFIGVDSWSLYDAPAGTLLDSGASTDTFRFTYVPAVTYYLVCMKSGVQFQYTISASNTGKTEISLTTEAQLLILNAQLNTVASEVWTEAKALSVPKFLALK